jgi:hypothetical protein
MCCVIFATASEPERKYAKESIPQIERKMQMGTSTTRAIAHETQADLVIAIFG